MIIGFFCTALADLIMIKVALRVAKNWVIIIYK
jgi:hypothetical protein